jgi:hypothetical protein
MKTTYNTYRAFKETENLMNPGVLFFISLFASLILFTSDTFAQNTLSTEGCTDPLAINYDQQATINDGSCIYEFTTVSFNERYILPCEVEETSGLIFFNNKFWTQNDDTDNHLYSFGFEYDPLFEAHPMEGLQNKDWEEIQQDENYLYIGDIGNNSGNRTDLKIYKIEKASLFDGQPGIAVDSIMFSFEDQNNFDPPGPLQTDFDAEAFVVTGTDIYVLSKQWISHKTAVYRFPNEAGVHEAEKVDEYNVEGLVTGITYMEDMQLAALTIYDFPEVSAPRILLLYDFPEHDFFGGNKRFLKISNLIGRPIEAITTINGLDFYITNERVEIDGMLASQHIYHFDLAEYLEDYIQRTGPPHTSEGAQTSNDLPQTAQLHQNYPNPFNPSTTIAYDLSTAGDVKLEVYNALGLKVATMVNEAQAAGSYVQRFDASRLPSGMYFYRLTSNGYQSTKSMLLLK